MLCRHPYQEGTAKFPCGRCIYCRKNRSRQWTGRLLLELDKCPAAAFVTLTYDDAHLPADGALDKWALRDFMKKARNYYPAKSLRFYGVGEYGDQNWRPHYHLIVFGMSMLDASIVSKCWTSGYSYLGSVTPSSMCYVAGYIEKKWNQKLPPHLLGKQAPFARMSLRPGIGANYFKQLTKTQLDTLASTQWDNSSLRIAGSKYHLPAYLRKKITDQIDVTFERKKERRDSRVLQIAGKAYAEDSSQSSREYKNRVMGQFIMPRKGKL